MKILATIAVIVLIAATPALGAVLTFRGTFAGRDGYYVPGTAFSGTFTYDPRTFIFDSDGLVLSDLPISLRVNHHRVDSNPGYPSGISPGQLFVDDSFFDPYLPPSGSHPDINLVFTDPTLQLITGAQAPSVADLLQSSAYIAFGDLGEQFSDRTPIVFEPVIPAVEPKCWLLLPFGLGLIGAVSRRKRDVGAQWTRLTPELGRSATARDRFWYSGS